MLTNETINEMVRIVREGKRMCESCEKCIECEAAHIDCVFYATNEDLAKLMQIVDAWSIAHPKEEQQEEAEQQKEAGNDQSHSNNTLEGRVEHLEKYVCEINEKLSLFIRDTVEKIEEIDGRIAHQNAEKELHEQLGVLPNIAKGSANTPPKKHTRLEILLRDFPNAMLCPDGSSFLRPCSVDTSYITSVCANQANCAECRRKYWNEQVEGI